MFPEEELIFPYVRELQYFVREGERWSRVNNLTDISNVTFKKPKSKTNAADYVIEALCSAKEHAQQSKCNAEEYTWHSEFNWML